MADWSIGVLFYHQKAPLSRVSKIINFLGDQAGDVGQQPAPVREEDQDLL